MTVGWKFWMTSRSIWTRAGLTTSEREAVLVAFGTSLALGLAGNVEKGPSCTERLLGGLPLSLPVAVPLLADQALDTAGPCRFLERIGPTLADEGTADLGSSKGLAE